MNKFLYNETNRRTNFQIYSGTELYMFRAVSLPIIRSFPLYIRHWNILHRFDDNLRAGSGWNCPDYSPVNYVFVRPFHFHILQNFRVHFSWYLLISPKIPFVRNSSLNNTGFPLHSRSLQIFIQGLYSISLISFVTSPRHSKLRVAPVLMIYMFLNNIIWQYF
jgi:hypothetical protein